MPHRNQTIFDQGWMAWTQGAGLNENPHPPSIEITVDEHAAWRDGWHAACEDSECQEAQRDDWYGNRADYEYDKMRGE